MNSSSSSSSQNILHMYQPFPSSTSSVSATGGMGGDFTSSNNIMQPLSHHPQHSHPGMIQTSNHHNPSSKLLDNTNMHLLKSNNNNNNNHDEDEDDSESSDNSDTNNDTNNNLSRITAISNMNTLNSINSIDSNNLYTMPPQSLGRTESIDSVSNTAKRSARVRHQDEITATTTRAGIGSVDPEDNDGDPSERKRRRNTEAARRSRLKKMQKIETLDASVMILQRDRKDLEVKVAVLENEKLTLLARQKDLMDRVSTLEQHLHEAHQAMLKMNSMKGDARQT
ncbi:hypothetical protein BJ741DRAFT_712814 [Chytriomyces cf. hyalinus JEL632]|nr:hypothetical protein BJ741DRAFT_712814 [Chytriomyces cf. hyalinus JEL632]